MKWMSLFLLLTLGCVGWSHDDYHKIILATYLHKSKSDKILETALKKFNSDPILKQLQNKHSFHYVSRKSGKYYIVVIEPFKNQKVIKKVFSIVRRDYPDAFINPFHPQTIIKHSPDISISSSAKIEKPVINEKNVINQSPAEYPPESIAIPLRYSEMIRIFLINGIYFFLWMSLSAIIIIVGHKAIVEMRTLKFEKLKKRYRNEITDYLFHPDFSALTKVTTPLEFRAASDVAIELIETFNDPHYLHILHQYLEKFRILKFYVSLSKKPLSLQRHDAIERLAMFKYKKNRSFFIKLLSDRTNKYEDLINALIGLSYIFDIDDIEIFLSSIEHIDTSGKFSEFLFYNAIQRILEKKSFDSLHVMYEKLYADQDYLSLKAFIEAIADTQYDGITPRLYDLYHITDRLDIKITIIRTLGVLPHSEEGCRLCMDAIKSSDMVLRIVAAKSISICHCPEAAKAAEKALYDDSFRVRHNISRSLLSLPDGIEILQSTFATTTDKYARQSAAFALHLRETSHA